MKETVHTIEENFLDRETKLEKLLEEIRQALAKEEALEQELNKKSKNIEAEIRGAQQIYKSLEKERNKYKNGFNEILDSRIWKLLEPARKVGRIGKKGPALNEAAVALQGTEDLAALAEPKKAVNRRTASKKVTNKNLPKKKWQVNADRKIERAKRKLLNLGFVDTAYQELLNFVEDDDKTYLRKEAAWQLALFHANQYTKEDSKASLRFLEIAEEKEKDPIRIRQISVMKAEALELLEDREPAKTIIRNEMTKEETMDLYLAYANLETSLEKRLEWLNKGLRLHGISGVSINPDLSATLYDCLESEPSVKSQPALSDNPKVTVIMPVYNAEQVIQTSLNSVLNQTYKNLEVLVVDDCSPDNTAMIVKEYMSKDTRVKLIQAEQNGGAYMARNLGLKEATGDFVTCNDADDWSHPQKIETQVRHLVENPLVIGNESQQARATEDLKFYRRGNPGYYVFSNMSSFMFRREKVMQAIGYWDCVRFGADSEFLKRVKKHFGEESLVALETGPLTFQRQSSGSLTANSAFGYHGFFMGVRKEYFEAFSAYHKTGNSLYYEFPKAKRAFPIPEPMWPKREEKREEGRHFDVILVSDFRLDGGSTLSSVEEIKAHKAMGLKTGLIQMYRYDYNPNKKINPKVREQLDENCQFLFYGESATCDLLILRYPPVLQEKQSYVPNVTAKKINIIINQTPMSDYGPDGVVRFDFPTCQKNLVEYFGKPGTWYPIGPLVRETLHQYHEADLSVIDLSDKDWVNIIDIEEWDRITRPEKGGPIKIGRHSRGQFVKWPADPNEILSIYPDDEKYEIHVLGGAEAPEKALGELPSNWRVLEFGQIHPKDFLKDIDVFVYYTHPDWVESFGRVIIEAMAVGVPVIIPPVYKDLFGEAAIYAEPAEVKAQIDLLMNDDYLYDQQVKKAHEYIEQRFGYTAHASRVKAAQVEFAH
ncbi:glycosyltransferase [Pullulanibacillus sp. KACC 23026]|uniref:glycosyltransferase n=1 Tax=Pullulanibacillus sp. KACC 23026 TaxID=3028315 RepID=UPI0023B04182|nr:glycosyltransferase [Pullulanibacillus sp. KACC 23026]WEG13298.1 glycosyltransferase [Pullulanibacillus sp. KACC 23026]